LIEANPGLVYSFLPGMPEPQLRVYPRYTVVAEKLEAPTWRYGKGRFLCFMDAIQPEPFGERRHPC
jgi:hypothetical protein